MEEEVTKKGGKERGTVAFSLEAQEGLLSFEQKQGQRRVPRTPSFLVCVLPSHFSFLLVGSQ